MTRRAALNFFCPLPRFQTPQQNSVNYIRLNITAYQSCSPSHSMPVLSKEKPFEHSQLKLPGVLTQEAREPHALFWAAHSLLSGTKQSFFVYCFFFCIETVPQIISWCMLTNAGGLVLGEAWRTLASEAANGVDTKELAVMLLGWTLIQILEANKHETISH